MGFGVGALGFLSFEYLDFFESFLDRRPADGVLLFDSPFLGVLVFSVDARKADFEELLFLLEGRLLDLFEVRLLELLLMYECLESRLACDPGLLLN